MSFFSRKPNPAVPPVVGNMITPPTPATVQRVRTTVPAQGFNLGGVGQGGLPQTQQASKSENEKQALSNTRFRSFAERYIVERCRDWKESEIDERAWEAILQARSIYNKVKEVGRTLGPDA